MLSRPRQSRPGPGRHAHDRARLSRQHRQSALRPDTTARPKRRLRGQQGSGTAIGVAIIYPVLMAVIVALQAITDATRTEQSLQVAADRAAQTAALCCETIGHAAASAKESLAAALSARGVACVDGTTGTRLSRDSLQNEIDVVFYDVYGHPRYDESGSIYYYDKRQSLYDSEPMPEDARRDGLIRYDSSGSGAYYTNATKPVIQLWTPAGQPYDPAFDEDGNLVANPKGLDPGLPLLDPKQPDTPVPRAGLAEVHVTCTLETGQLGRTVAGPDGVRRYAVGQSVVDPYRQRAPAPVRGP